MKFEDGPVYESDKRPKCQKDPEGIHIDEEEITYGVDNDGRRREAVVLRCKIAACANSSKYIEYSAT